MDNIPQKQCTNPDCRQWFPATPEFFYRDKNKKDGLDPWCKPCKKKYDRVYSNRPHVKDRHQAYQKSYCSIPEHREKKRLYDKGYREVYYANPEIIERKHTYQEAYRSHPKTKERIQSYNTSYIRRPDVRAQHCSNTRNYRARKKAIPGIHTPQQIQEMLKRQKYRCYYCSTQFKKSKGRYIYHVDHTFPISRVAGTDIPANDISYLVLACPTCNTSKGDSFPWEFAKGGKLL